MKWVDGFTATLLATMPASGSQQRFTTYGLTEEGALEVMNTFFVAYDMDPDVWDDVVVQPTLILVPDTI